MTEAALFLELDYLACRIDNALQAVLLEFILHL
jgi:hypothetical protein